MIQNIPKLALITWHPIFVLLLLLYIISRAIRNDFTNVSIILIIFSSIYFIISLYNYFTKNKFLNWLYNEQQVDQEPKRSWSSFTDLLKDRSLMTTPEEFSEYFKSVEKTASKISKSQKRINDFVNSFIFDPLFAGDEQNEKILYRLGES